MNEESILIPSCDGVEIPAIVVRPSGEETTLSITLLLHGITTHKDEYGQTFRKLAEMLALEGQASIRFDFRGHGDSSASLNDFAFRTQLIDILAAVDWLDEEQEIKRFKLFAASFSAPAAISAAVVLGQSVESLVLLAPVLDPYRTFVEPTTDWGEDLFGIKRIREALRCRPLELEPGFELGSAFAADLLMVDARGLLGRTACPVSILHGDKDGMVPFDVSRHVAAESESISFVHMEGTEHGLAEAGDENQVASRTAENYRRAVEAIIDRG